MTTAQPSASPDTPAAGAHPQRRMRVGVHSLDEQLNEGGRLFTSAAASHPLAAPCAALHAYGQAQGIDFLTLDQASANQLDAVVFLDRPSACSAQANAALAANHLAKILIIGESAQSKADNWERQYHKQFDYIFTWNDDLVDGIRYIKSNFVGEMSSAFDGEQLAAAFGQRKLLTLVERAVLMESPNLVPTELFTHRLRTIDWFENNAPADFDLYGPGWDGAAFPSYRGIAGDTLALLANYRFAVCFEDAMSYPGFITRRIHDCLRAGTVPVYGGAPNISRWIPADCFISVGQFSDYRTLYLHLASMDAPTHAGYLSRMQAFLASPAAYPFSTACLVNTLSAYLGWAVQTRRGELPQLARGLGIDASGATHSLLQDKDSLALHIGPKAQAAVLREPGTAELVRQQMTALRRDDLVVCLGYGPEQETFVRARALWQFYASHFPGIKIIFMRDSDALPRGQVVSEGDDLVIGTGEEHGDGPRGQMWNADGAWSAECNQRHIFRQITLYDYLLRKYPHHFHLCGATITSVVDLRGVVAMLERLPRTGCFAGMPGKLFHAPYQGVRMVHGANTWVSRDVMELMRARYLPGHEYTMQPNDHWQGLILPDIVPTPLPLFSFHRERTVGDGHEKIGLLTRELIRMGHFHFRIKTASAAAGTGRREDVDPWVMLKIMETILATPSSPEATWLLQERLVQSTVPTAPLRAFPLDDEETLRFFPDY